MKQMSAVAVLVVAMWGIGCGSRSSGATVSKDVAPMPGSAIVDSSGAISLPAPPVTVMNKTVPGFVRGINLGNGLDAPSIGEWGVVLEENHFKYVSEAGLDHVRLPVRFSAYAMEEAPYTIEESFFEKVDWALEMANKYELSILVDVHHYEELMKTPHAHTERFLGMWKQIAERYRDAPASVAFELLNEPCDALTVDILNPLMKQAFELVRETNPTRLIFINSYFWASTEWLDKMDVSFADDNTVATFHMYQPIVFTHQGAEWMPPEYHTRGIVFPGPPQAPVEISGAAMEVDWVHGWLRQYNRQGADVNPGGPSTVWAEFERVAAFIEKTGLPTYLGEFGVVDYADEDSRYAFLKLVIDEAERRGIGWALWDDGGRFKAIDVKTGKWVPVVERAVLGAIAGDE